MPLNLSPDRVSLYERNKQWAVPASVAGETYDTRLGPRLEQQFRAWAQANQQRLREYNPDDPTYDYDMRGWWRENVLPGRVGATDMQMMGEGVHFPDKYKKPWHTSFSRESTYANPDAPKWVKQGSNWLLVDRTGQILVKE